MAFTVMVVDDVAHTRKFISAILSAAYYQVVAQASCAKEACELYQQFSPQLVLMDLVMPQQSGIEALQELMKIDKKAKVILMSGVDHETFISQALLAGAVDFLPKPFTKHQLLCVVERALVSDDVILGRTGV